LKTCISIVFSFGRLGSSAASRPATAAALLSFDALPLFSSSSSSIPVRTVSAVREEAAARPEASEKAWEALRASSARSERETAASDGKAAPRRPAAAASATTTAFSAVICR
jgi:hypothetical protein